MLRLGRCNERPDHVFVAKQPVAPLVGQPQAAVETPLELPPAPLVAKLGVKRHVVLEPIGMRPAIQGAVTLGVLAILLRRLGRQLLSARRRRVVEQYVLPRLFEGQWQWRWDKRRPLVLDLLPDCSPGGLLWLGLRRAAKLVDHFFKCRHGSLRYTARSGAAPGAGNCGNATLGIKPKAAIQFR